MRPSSFRIKLVLCIAVWAMLLAFLFSGRGGVQILEAKILDHFFNWREKAGGERVIIVDIRQDLPCEADRLAGLLEELLSKGISAIGIDMNCGEPGQSEALMKLSGSFDKVVFATREGGKERKGSRTGFISVFIRDPDGVVRKTKLYVPSEGEGYLSFALYLLLIAENRMPDEIIHRNNGIYLANNLIIPLEKSGLMRISYRKRGVFSIIPLDSIRKMPVEACKGRVAIVGSVQSSRNRFTTPVAANVPEILIQAQIIGALLDRDFIIPPPPAGILLVLLICSFIPAIALVYARNPLTGGFLPILLCAAGYCTAAFQMFSAFSLHLPIISPLTAFLLSTVFSVGYNVFHRKRIPGRGLSMDSPLSGDMAPTLVDEYSSEASDTAFDISSFLQGLKGVPYIKRGAELGKYKILEKLGAGGMGEVFLVEHLPLKVMRVIKMIKPELLPNNRIRERFCQEAEAAARLKDPTIITIHDFGEIYGIPYIEMEYFEGKSLRTELKESGPLSAPRVYALMEKITAGLRCAHEASPSPLIHSDLKPENILISLRNADDIKLIDFGLVKVLHEGFEGASSAPETMGTPFYMAPELFMSEMIGPGSDIYSLGVILFEMVTAKKPFEDGGVLEVIDAHLHRPVPSASGMNPQYPVEIDEVIRKAMEKKIDDRYGSVEEFFMHLGEVLSQTDERR